MAEIPGTVVHVLSGQKYDRYVGGASAVFALRENFWTSPFRPGRDGTSSECVRLYEQHVRETTRLLHNVHKLIGMTLACNCEALKTKTGAYKPLKATVKDRDVCHGQVLLRMAYERAEALRTSKILEQQIREE
jgi:hypothetical protein